MLGLFLSLTLRGVGIGDTSCPGKGNRGPAMRVKLFGVARREDSRIARQFEEQIILEAWPVVSSPLYSQFSG